MLQAALLRYGLNLAERQFGSPPPGVDLAALAPQGADPRVERARRLLGDWSDEVDAASSPRTLAGITSFLRLADGTPAPPHSLPLGPLTASLRPPPPQAEAEMGAAFWERAARLRPGRGALESFAALLDRYAAALPGTLGSPVESDGVALALQFRLVAALALTLADDHDSLLLVEGDLSGIQELLYTLSAKGAAKALRGRSFYLQLLSDAVLRATLRALRLPTVCVMSSAGGNFRLLARAADGARLEGFRRRINQTLLDLHGGELALALGWAPLPAHSLATGAFARVAQELGEELEAQKARPFGFLDDAGLLAFFAPQGVGGADYCEVCHVDLGPGEELCSQCASFRERVPGGGEGLARLLADADDGSYLLVTSSGGLVPRAQLPGWRGRPPWHVALQALGYRYTFTHQAALAGAHAGGAEPAAWCYRLNETDALPATPHGDVAYGFRFLANSTPRIAERGAALERLRERVHAQRAAGEGDERLLESGAIRNIELMARWDRTGIDRYAVLRMDVDDLGSIFRERLEEPSLPRTSALSGALTRFFEGWLTTVCRETAAAWQREAGELLGDESWAARQKLPYVLYAGGDDLLIVGPWDLLPRLALRLRRDLGAFSRSGVVDADESLGPAPLTMSAGIFAESAQFPLYQAADQAGAALSAAKRRRGVRRVHGEQRRVVVKDAVTMFDVTVSWAEFADAERLALRLAALVGRGVARPDGTLDRAPHALLGLLADVAQAYAAASGGAEAQIAFGRWMPMLAYGLRQMAERVQRNEALRGAILGLSAGALGLDGPLDLTRSAEAGRWTTIRYLDLPVRWAEFLVREGEAG